MNGILIAHHFATYHVMMREIQRGIEQNKVCVVAVVVDMPPASTNMVFEGEKLAPLQDFRKKCEPADESCDRWGREESLEGIRDCRSWLTARCRCRLSAARKRGNPAWMLLGFPRPPQAHI